MTLTEKEQVEINLLRQEQKECLYMPKMYFERLEYLQKKQWHNCCLNPKCTGYEGMEIETVCPKCKSILYKLL